MAFNRYSQKLIIYPMRVASCGQVEGLLQKTSTHSYYITFIPVIEY